MSFKSGFIAVTGRANVGKSSLVNALVGQKIAIVSHKAQTTRQRIKGIRTTETSQMIFVDTPGMHKPKNKLDEKMKEIILESLKDVDLVLFLVDIASGFGPGDTYMLESLGDLSRVLLVLNKMDLISQEQLEMNLQEIPRIDEFADVLALSAIYPETLTGLLTIIEDKLPEGPAYYPSETFSDSDFRFHVTEIIREKALHYLEDEVPHGIAVILEGYDRIDGVLHMNVTLVVERESHKAIVIGKRGRKIKGIGKAARLELEETYGERIMLELFVKVRKNWRNDHQRLSEFGYDQ